MQFEMGRTYGPAAGMVDLFDRYDVPKVILVLSAREEKNGFEDQHIHWVLTDRGKIERWCLSFTWWSVLYPDRYLAACG